MAVLASDFPRSVRLVRLSGSIGVVPTLLIHHNEQEGLVPFHAVVESTVQRARPVLLTALAAILTFIALTHSMFWAR